MRVLLMLLAALLVACSPAPVAPAPVPSPSPSPVALPAPGFALKAAPWAWPQQGAPSSQLAAVLPGLTDPVKVADFLQANTEWRDDYDTGVFLKPDDTVSAKRGVCSAFARFWVYTLGRIGIKADFVAFWGPSSAHAVAVFRAPDGRYRLASNQFFYSTIDLDPGNRGREAALTAAAAEFYGGEWSTILVFSDTGVITQELKNAKATNAPQSPPDTPQLFRIKR